MLCQIRDKNNIYIAFDIARTQVLGTSEWVDT